MFKYVTECLHLSEAEAYLRIEVARASRKHPMLLDRLSDGSLHVSGIATLAPILTEANRETVLARAAFKTKQEIKELVAELSPKPDVPDTIRKLRASREGQAENGFESVWQSRLESPRATGFGTVQTCRRGGPDRSGSLQDRVYGHRRAPGDLEAEFRARAVYTFTNRLMHGWFGRV
jgi:hypothetical protein